MKTSKITSFLAVMVCPGALSPGAMREAGEEKFSRAVNKDAKDCLISRKVEDALSNDIELANKQVQVQTHHGIVRLNGGVDTPVQKQHAGELAHSVYGVRKVQNRIAVKDLFRHYLTSIFTAHHKTH